MKQRLLIVAITLLILSLACNVPGTVVSTPTGSSDLVTQVAATFQAMETLTTTPQPVAQASVSPTATFIPPLPTATQSPVEETATPTTQPCDQAQFIADVTVPDGTKMTPGQAFTKTWRLRNLGTCTWTKTYALVFTGGDAMGAAAVINLPGDVPTGATVDISVDMKAPNTPGDYQGNWKLRNTAGQLFGVVSDQPFYVQIKVVAATATVTPTFTATPTGSITPTTQTSSEVYNFVTNACSAQWLSKSGEGALPCPGATGDSKGYVMLLNNPTLETGAVEMAGVLLTVPRSEASGVITGAYPAISIQQGYHFKATIGCLNQVANCSVTYQLNYRLSGVTDNLGQWTQTYDSTIQGIDVDLSSLAGQSVEIVLVVLAGDSFDQDQAVWVNPRIVKE